MRRALAAVAVVLLTGCSGGGGTALPTASPLPTTSPTVSPTPSPTVSPTASPTPSPTVSPTRSPRPSPTATRSPTPSPSAVVAARQLWRLPTQRHVVALTFDAGSDVGYAAAILDLLKAKGIRASFGLTGDWVRANPALVRRMAAEGHQLVNHTDRHLSFTGYSTKTAPLTRQQRWAALAAAESAIRSAAGVAAKPWFRPPYGDRDASVDRDVAAAGYRYELMWTVDTRGWKGVPAAEVADRVMAELQPGEIVLMHVGKASTDYSALADVIDRIRAAGYGFVRADG
ncbi:MAG TPA: polysaccharide deacetylase family protein [Mycobacteriales bacterium]|nr:polysaccharide deacetylase family protein [Mycobacteriales bacterium]